MRSVVMPLGERGVLWCRLRTRDLNPKPKLNYLPDPLSPHEQLSPLKPVTSDPPQLEIIGKPEKIGWGPLSLILTTIYC